ncbi:MAG: hypothetical protein R3Y64_00510 [Peptostreptococcaceae bacterium]
MVGLEKDILLLISKVRCITESQVSKVVCTTRKSYFRKPVKQTLKKMCNEYTLKKYPVNISYQGYRENSYVYYLNGGKTYKGKELLKVIMGSEIVIKLSNSGCRVKRIFRNPKIDNRTYDIYIEYINKYCEVKQILVDIQTDKFILSKYENMDRKIEKSTIPFIETPTIFVITNENYERCLENRIDLDIKFIDFSLDKLNKYL